MPLPRPRPGLVIHYEYLWRYEHETGEERGEGRHHPRRPCVIVAAVTDAAGLTEVVVAPITHVAPRAPSAGIEIPLRVKTHLGLDERRSWVVTTDLNVFVWPGIDLYPVPHGPPGVYEYGFLPPRLFEQIVAAITAAGSIARATRRTE
jgi:hypothetical protein